MRLDVQYKMIYDLKNSSKWHRRILNSYWVAVFISISATIINSFFSSKNYKYYLNDLIIKPGVMLIIIMIITELTNAKFKKNHDYLLIATAIALAIIQIIKHVGVFDIMLSLLVFPIFISTFTFERRKIIFAFLSSLISLFLLVCWVSYKRSIYIDEISVLTVSFILLAGAYLSLTITMRGKKILSELESEMTAKQELLIKNVFMEKASKMDLMTNLYNHATFHLHLEGLIEQFKKDRRSLRNTRKMNKICLYQMLKNNRKHKGQNKTAPFLSASTMHSFFPQ